MHSDSHQSCFLFTRFRQSGIPDLYSLQDAQTSFAAIGKNTGNIAFISAIRSHIPNAKPPISWDADVNEINAGGSIGIVPAANNIGAHADFGSVAKIFQKLSCNLVMIGLGAQSNFDGPIPPVPAGTLSWVSEVIKHRASKESPNISVRGPLSQKILDHYGFQGQTVVLGCPSLFINPSYELGQVVESNIRPIKRVAILAGNERWPHLKKLESSLTRIVTATQGSYIGQSAINMFCLTRGEAHLMDLTDLEACRNYSCPEMSIDEFIHWSVQHCNLFFNVEPWMEHYRRFDFVIGARLHGVMLAIQAGIPGVVIAHDSRTLELCQTMLIPYVLAKDVKDGVKLEDLPQLFNFNGKLFDVNRRALAKRYVDFIESNNLTPAGWLKDLGSVN